MYCIVLSIKLFFKEECIWCSSFRNWQACGYQVPPSVETGCFPWIRIKPDRNLSATNMFLSLDMDSARISLFSGSIAIHNQISSEPTFIKVSSTMYSSIFFLFDSNSSHLYLCIQSLIAVWLLLINLDKAFDVFLNERPRKYREMYGLNYVFW